MGDIRDTFKDRSEENWRAAVACLKQKSYNPAANRFYFAVYHAVVYWADKAKLVRCQKSHAGFHQSLPENIAEHGGEHGNDYRAVFAEVYALRIQADYKPHPVKEKHLKPDLVQRANHVRKVMLGLVRQSRGTECLRTK